MEKKWNHGNWQDGVKRPSSNSSQVGSIFTYFNLECSFAKVRSGWALHSLSPITSLINPVKLCLVAFIHSYFPASFYCLISSSTNPQGNSLPVNNTTFPTTVIKTSRLLEVLMITQITNDQWGYAANYGAVTLNLTCLSNYASQCVLLLMQSSINMEIHRGHGCLLNIKRTQLLHQNKLNKKITDKKIKYSNGLYNMKTLFFKINRKHVAYK